MPTAEELLRPSPLVEEVNGKPGRKTFSRIAQGLSKMADPEHGRKLKKVSKHQESHISLSLTRHKSSTEIKEYYK